MIEPRAPRWVPLKTLLLRKSAVVAGGWDALPDVSTIDRLEACSIVSGDASEAKNLFRVNRDYLRGRGLNASFQRKP